MDKALGGSTGDQLSAHHVIPVAVWKENEVFLDQIGLKGQMNSATNGIHIPGSASAMKDDVGKGIRVFHNTNHNKYSELVRVKIIEIRDEHRKLQMEMKRKI